MPNNKDYINSYLKENKDKFSKEALILELKKAGYGEGEIDEEVGSVYGELKQKSSMGFSYFLKRHKINSSIAIILFLLALYSGLLGDKERFIASLLLLFIPFIFLNLIYFLSNKFIKNGKTIVKVVGVFVLILFFVFLISFCSTYFIANKEGYGVYTIASLVRWISMLASFILFFALIKFIINKLLIKNKIKKIFIFGLALIIWWFVSLGLFVGITFQSTGMVDFIDVNLGMGSPEKIACLKAGDKWQRVCAHGTFECVHTYSDAGKKCTQSSDCQSGECWGINYCDKGGNKNNYPCVCGGEYSFTYSDDEYSEAGKACKNDYDCNRGINSHDGYGRCWVLNSGHCSTNNDPCGGCGDGGPCVD
jgi:hypothetical protein